MEALIQEIRSILDKLYAADEAYYEAAAEVTLLDDEYDAMKESLPDLSKQLRNLDTAHPLIMEVKVFLEGVGATVSSSLWQKKSHPIPMGSLSKPKAKGPQAIHDWFQKIATQV